MTSGFFLRGERSEDLRDSSKAWHPKTAWCGERRDGPQSASKNQTLQRDQSGWKLIGIFKLFFGFRRLTKPLCGWRWGHEALHGEYRPFGKATRPWALNALWEQENCPCWWKRWVTISKRNRSVGGIPMSWPRPSCQGTSMSTPAIPRNSFSALFQLMNEFL